MENSWGWGGGGEASLGGYPRAFTHPPQYYFLLGLQTQHHNFYYMLQYAITSMNI